MRYFLSLLMVVSFIQAMGMSDNRNGRICTAKSYLPVEINAQTKQSSAQVKIKFFGALDGVEVKIVGLDGLDNISVAQNTHNLTAINNEEKIFDVSYVAPEGRSYLSVEISVNNGASMIKVFQVGAPTASQKSAAQQNSTYDREGNRIILMPVINNPHR